MSNDDDMNLPGLDAERRPTFRDFYYLMKWKVTKILLVSSLYDAFTLEEEGLLTEQISGEYQELALSSPPQVVRVPSGEQALRELDQSRYDLVITMSQVVDLDPCEFCGEARHRQHDVPIVLLATTPDEVSMFLAGEERKRFDRAFYWTGDATLLLAIIKCVEDKRNIVADTQHGVVKVILVVEDSPTDYSSFLPTLYTEIMKQTQALIAEGLNEQEKWFRKKARPKILLAETFEEAQGIYRSYGDHLLGIITDVAYPRAERLEDEAGFRFIEEVVRDDIPVLVQSRNRVHGKRAEELGFPFRHKHPDTLPQGIRDFLKEHLGFGDFVFRMPDGTQVERVSDIREFVDVIQKVPLESIRHHGLRNDFSRWLMARGEITLARELKPKKVSDFGDDAEVRKYLVGAIRESRREKRAGTIAEFSEEDFELGGTFTRLGGGSLGGKGRGLAFLSLLLHQSDVRNKFEGCRVRLPDTLVLGTDVFDRLMTEHDLYERMGEEMSDREVARHFMNARLPGNIRDSLRVFLSHVREPLAVRSSSLLEDSQSQPFAGVYATYMLPNNSPDDDLRLDQLCRAIKLVYASTFSSRARAYIQAAAPGVEEKMAVIIQKLVGRAYDGRYYPIYSGVGRSCNFYPAPPLERDDGIVCVALGLGRIVVEGGKALSFSPARPDVLPGLSTPEEIIESTQSYFYSLDLDNQDFDLSEGEESTLKTLDIADAGGDGTLKYVASTYDAADGRLRDSAAGRGPKVITFAGIRKYGMLPFSSIIEELLAVGAQGMGRPVEIEFAGTLSPDGSPEFYVLQIRPFVTLRERQQVMIEEAEMESALISTDTALGNGALEGICDIVLVRPDNFDPTRTIDIAAEVSDINKSLSGTPYVLIGPGRWGTRDRFAGIPVQWDQISWARTIVETSMENFRVTPSQGSHFFHNITSLGIMYLTVPHDSPNAFIDWDKLLGLPAVAERKHVRHLRLTASVVVKVDGQSGRGVVFRPPGSGSCQKHV